MGVVVIAALALASKAQAGLTSTGAAYQIDNVYLDPWKCT